jgi:hypothetical protein
MGKSAGGEYSFPFFCLSAAVLSALTRFMSRNFWMEQQRVEQYKKELAEANGKAA